MPSFAKPSYCLTVVICVQPEKMVISEMSYNQALQRQLENDEEFNLVGGVGSHQRVPPSNNITSVGYSGGYQVVMDLDLLPFSLSVKPEQFHEVYVEILISFQNLFGYYSKLIHCLQSHQNMFYNRVTVLRITN